MSEQRVVQRLLYEREALERDYERRMDTLSRLADLNCQQKAEIQRLTAENEALRQEHRQGAS